MATTISITSKTATGISGTTTKATSYTTYTALGPGFDYDTIYQNRVARETASGAAGTYSWTFSSGLQPNTQYGLVAFAVGGGDSEISAVHDGTLPAPSLTALSVSNVTTTTATINYTTAADGGYYPKSIQYSLDNGTTWTTGATVASGSATSGSFAISNLLSGATYNVSVRVTTTAGSTSSGNRTFITVAVQQSKKKLYGSSSGLSTSVDGFYGSVSSVAQTVTKVYGQSPETGYIITGLRSGAIDLGRFNSMYYRTFGPFLQKPYKVSAMNYTNNTVLVSVRTWAGEFINDLFSYPQGEYNNEGVIWGIDTEPVPSGSSVLTIALFDASSSVQPISRLIYQGFGHLDYGYGTVTYYTDSSHTTTNTVTISTLTELDHLSGLYSQTRSSWNVTVGNITISNKDIVGVTLTNKVTSLPPYFLCGCESFNSDLILPSSLTTIRTSGESTYGSAFILSCSNMTSAINVGGLDPSIVQAATSSCFAVSQNTDAAYVQGIKIAGANRSAWLTAFPNRSSRAPYRKLVDAGY